MLSKNKKFSKTPQPAKARGSALKAPKSAPQLRKKKPVEEPEDEEDIKAMLKNLKYKGKNDKEKLLAMMAKGGSEESEDDEDLMAADDDDDDSADSDIGEDDDDDDDDDDEEEDDDDDDDDEDDEDDDEEGGSDLEEEIVTATKNQLQKKTKKGEASSSGSNAEVIKARKDSKKSANKKENKAVDITASIEQELSADSKRRDERDRRSLFVKHLRESVTEESLKNLSPDVEEVRLNTKMRRGAMEHRGYAFLGFKDEKTAEKNFHALQGKILEGRKILVDFVGAKSQHRSEHEKIKQLKPEDIDATKLYVTGFDVDMTSEKLLKLFPKAYNVTLPIHGKDKKPTGYGFVHFATEEEAKEAHDSIQDKITAGHRLTVLFAKKTREGKKRPKPTQETKEAPAEKKAKIEEEDDGDEEDNDENDVGADDDDEDDDEDDDDDDDDDEDEDDESE